MEGVAHVRHPCAPGQLDTPRREAGGEERSVGVVDASRWQRPCSVELAARRDDGHTRPAHGLDAIDTQRGEQHDRRGVDAPSAFERKRSFADVRSGAAHVLPSTLIGKETNLLLAARSAPRG